MHGLLAPLGSGKRRKSAAPGPERELAGGALRSSSSLPAPSHWSACWHLAPATVQASTCGPGDVGGGRRPTQRAGLRGPSTGVFLDVEIGSSNTHLVFLKIPDAPHCLSIKWLRVTEEGSHGVLWPTQTAAVPVLPKKTLVHR